MSAISIIRGDITKLKVDVIVNAANEKMLGGAGVDGAIHKAAGPNLLYECSLLKVVKRVRSDIPVGHDGVGPIYKYEDYRCLPGNVIKTDAYSLPCKAIIHAVGPRYNQLDPLEAHELLRQCYYKACEETLYHGYKSVAFPCISTGVFGFPLSKACEIAMDTCLGFESDDLRVTFCIFDEENFTEYYLRYHHMKAVQKAMSRSRIAKDTV